MMCPAGAGSTRRSKARSDRRRPPSVSATANTAGDLAECSCEGCRTCSAALLADCIALCCCPCAVVSLLATAFVKLPWVVGKRWLRSLRRKRELRGVQAMREKGEGELGEQLGVVERDVGGRAGTQVDEGGEIEKGRRSMCTRSEVEKVWLELHQLGHLGFGRVSNSTPSPWCRQGSSLDKASIDSIEGTVTR